MTHDPVGGQLTDTDPLLCLVQELMCNEEGMHAVLRLMCLLSLTQSGIAKKYFDALRKEFLQSYGHEFLLMLSKLQDAGCFPAIALLPYLHARPPSMSQHLHRPPRHGRAQTCSRCKGSSDQGG